MTGLLYGDVGQLRCQLIGIALECLLWAFGVTFILFKVINAIKSFRVSPGSRNWKAWTCLSSAAWRIPRMRWRHRPSAVELQS